MGLVPSRAGRTSDWPSCRCWPRRSWLHHYLAFECPIREIAAVSDRHCLATDSPRTCTQRYQLLLHRFTRRCVLFTPFLVFRFSLTLTHFRSLSLSPSISFSYCSHREPPFYCILVSFWLQSLRTRFPFIFLAISFYSCFIFIVQFILLFALSHYFCFIHNFFNFWTQCKCWYV